LDNQLYLVLKRNNLEHVIKDLFPKPTINFLEEAKEGRTWRRNHRQLNMMQRNSKESECRRSEWFLKDRHDKMNYMRT